MIQNALVIYLSVGCSGGVSAEEIEKHSTEVVLLSLPRMSCFCFGLFVDWFIGRITQKIMEEFSRNF